MSTDATFRPDQSLDFDWTERFRPDGVDTDRAVSALEDTDAAFTESMSEDDVRSAASDLNGGGGGSLDWDDGRTLFGVLEGAVPYDPGPADRFTGATATFPSITYEPENVSDSPHAFRVQFSDGFVYHFPRDAPAAETGDYPADGRYTIDRDQRRANNINGEFVRDQRSNETERTFGEATITDDLWTSPNAPSHSSGNFESVLESVEFRGQALGVDLALVPSVQHRPSPFLTALRGLAQFRARQLRGVGKTLDGLAPPENEIIQDTQDLASSASAAALTAGIVGTPPSEPEDLTGGAAEQLFPVSLVATGEAAESIVSGARTAGRVGSSMVGPALTVVSAYQGAREARQRTAEFGRFVRDSVSTIADSAVGQLVTQETCIDGTDLGEECIRDREVDTMTTVLALGALSQFQHQQASIALATATNPLAEDGAVDRYWRLLVESHLQSVALSEKLEDALGAPWTTPELREALTEAAELTDRMAAQTRLELDMLALVAYSYEGAGIGKSTTEERTEDTGMVEYTLTVRDATGTTVGSVTVDDEFDAAAFGRRVQFGVLGDTSRDIDRAIADYVRTADGETIEDWSTRDLGDYDLTRDGNGQFEVVSSPTSSGPAALQMGTGYNWTWYTSTDDLLELEPGTTVRGDLRHETDASSTYAMKSGFTVGADEDGDGGLKATLTNPGTERTAGARLVTPNESARVEFTPDIGAFYTLSIAIGEA